jgi:DNA-binding CsgD family transcriptional regulator
MPSAPPRSPVTPTAGVKTGVGAVPARDLITVLQAKDLEAVIDAAFPIVQRVVKCDFVSAFYRASPRGLLKERDSRGIEYSPQFVRRYIELTPAIPLALANPGVRYLTTRTAIRGRESSIRTSAFYREVMRPQGWRHGVAMCFWAEPAGPLPIFVLSSYRVEERADFRSVDLARLDAIYPFIAVAVSRLHEQEKARAVRDGMATSSRNGNRGFAALDSNLRLVEANAIARRLACAWSAAASGTRRSDTSRWLLPSQLSSACHAMRREWEALLLANPDATAVRRQRRISHPTANELSALITMVCHNASFFEPTFVVELERRARRDPAIAHQDAPLLQRLTVAERAVARVVMDGFSNQEIADRLGKSVDAVKFLLHRVYQKTGVTSRASLVAALRP